MSLILFDLDNTLLRGDSDHAWGEFLVEKNAVDARRFKADNDRYYQAYLDGSLDIYEFLEQHQLRPLAEHDRSKLEVWRREFMAKKVLPMIIPAARDLVEQHRQRGDTLLVITATNSFITAPIVKEFGIRHLLATEPEEIDGRFTGKVLGTPCYREGKLTRLKAWLGETGQSLTDSWFYSDSHNDLSLLNAVAHPMAVNPDAILAEHARARGWPVLNLA